MFNIYIRINSSNELEHIFCDDLENPLPIDTLYIENTEERPNLGSLIHWNGRLRYKVETGNIIVEKTLEEYFPISELREQKIAQLSKVTEEQIVKEYTWYDQIDLLNQLDPSHDTIEKKNAMIALIVAVRQASRAIKDAINLETDRRVIEEMNLLVDMEAIKASLA